MIFLCFPTSQATEAVWEEPEAEARPEEVEAPEYGMAKQLQKVSLPKCLLN